MSQGVRQVVDVAAIVVAGIATQSPVVAICFFSVAAAVAARRASVQWRRTPLVLSAAADAIFAVGAAVLALEAVRGSTIDSLGAPWWRVAAAWVAVCLALELADRYLHRGLWTCVKEALDESSLVDWAASNRIPHLRGGSQSAGGGLGA